jgi:hypothetical protein
MKVSKSAGKNRNYEGIGEKKLEKKGCFLMTYLT